MDLDRELAKLYREALAKAPDRNLLKAEQRGWIKGRNDCWKAPDEKQCMIDQYRFRIEDLRNRYLNAAAAGASKKTAAPKKAGRYAFDKVLKLQGVTFHVQATNRGSENELVITPSGLQESNEVIRQKIDGVVTGAEVADLNRDGSPEIYVYVNSAGSGTYGTLVAYSANNRKSLSEIYLPPLENESKKVSQGYMGHDQFTIVENYFGRRFPIYRKDDPNCCPTGGTRQLLYKLVPGEATWQLKLVKVRDFK